MFDQNLINLAKASLERGETKEQVYQQLLGQGHSVQDIADALEMARGGGERAETQKRTVSIVVVIGAILVGAGIFSFIASNWDKMDKPVKLFIIVASMLVSYGAGWYLREKKDLPKTGMALILLGSIIYGAGIFLVAQMFNIRAKWPDGFILWMLGIMVLSFAVDNSAFLFFAAVLGIIAVFGHPFDIFDSFTGYNPLLLTSTTLLVLTSIICFATARYFRKKAPAGPEDIY